MSGKHVLNLDSTRRLNGNRLTMAVNEAEILLFLLAVYANPTQEGKIGLKYIFCTATLYVGHSNTRDTVGKSI